MRPCIAARRRSNQVGRATNYLITKRNLKLPMNTILFLIALVMTVLFFITVAAVLYVIHVVEKASRQQHLNRLYFEGHANTTMPDDWHPANQDRNSKSKNKETII